VTAHGVGPTPIYQLLWAKWGNDQTHPLICHLIDVAQVALALWHTALTDSFRTQIAHDLHLDAESAGRLIAFWAGLHDLGKASPAFQRLNKQAQDLLQSSGLSFPRVFVRESCHHGFISAHVLPGLLADKTALSPSLAKKVARALGGHHGAWPSSMALLNLKSTQVGGQDWDAVRSRLLDEMMALFDPPQVSTAVALPEENALLTLLSGFVSVADWLGSMEEYFPYATTPLETADYVQRAFAQAQQALTSLGWVGWQPPQREISFQGLFQYPPRPMQEAVVHLATQLDRPALVIIEAPTGSGKTEAALYLADHWAHSCQQRGLYMAMPTMATSNQMFKRVKAVLTRRYPDSLVNLLLIHSHARWLRDVRALQLETTEELETAGRDRSGAVAAMAWFLPRKRSLLATFGVGTVDQALLGVLQTRHFFVRLFGLSHKTVIFDEVHAYDTYMATLFCRLLRWLHAVGASVIILSATLPARTRQQLLQAYAGEQQSMPSVSYPALTWAVEDQIGVIPLSASADRTVALEWVAREPEAIAQCLRHELRHGGCAALICNTVKRAQQIYRVLQEAHIVPQQDLVLFHGRFPFAWRQEIEQGVVGRFGKNGDRPQRAVVVATQVIEQSLDLDFDLMLSDLAPVDLLIQRAGRLHRHEGRQRPQPLSTPRLLLARPAEENGVPDFGPDARVYAPYVLLRSYLALQGRQQLLLPRDTEELIEAVYGERELPSEYLSAAIAARLTKAKQDMEEAHSKEVFQAQQRLVPSPQYEDLFDMTYPALEEDNPELHRAFRALTRLGPLSLSIICLHQTGDGLSLEPDGGGPAIDLQQVPDFELAQQLAWHAVGVTHYKVVKYFISQPVPAGWRDHPLLRYCRAALFTNGRCQLTGTRYTLRLSRELGLEIEEAE